MAKMTIKTKFAIGTACILLLVGAGVSIALYDYLRDIVTRDIYRETEIFISTADATRTYVKDILRPQMTELLPPGSFIPHAMSTTYVGREIMSRLRDRFPDFLYKRAAQNPMNPVNQADRFELKMLKWFSENRDTPEWHGLIKKNDRSFYTRLRAIYAEAECLSCHGNPADAPEGVRKLYGTDGGYNYRLGQIVAADTVYIPVDVTFERIKETAWLVFLVAFTSLFALVGLFYLLFNRTVVSELKGLLIKFRSIAEHPETDDQSADFTSGDEIEQLKNAFEIAAADLRQAHDKLRSSESKYRLLFETSQDAIIIFDDKTRIIDINEAGIKLFGFHDLREAVSIETSYQLFWDTRDAENFHQTLHRKGFLRETEFSMVDRNGKQLIIMISATRRRDKDRQITGIDGIFRDVTEKRRVEKYLAQTEKLASIGELASGVAHEINNPLGVIKCYANLIAKGQHENSTVLNDIQIIQKHTEQCESVVDALLRFARISEPMKTKIDIHLCIDDVLSMLGHQMIKEGITVEKQFHPDLPSITVDAQMIKQVFMNLFMNARQAMPQGGTLTVRTTMDSLEKRISIAIADTGSGISKKFVDRIFDPFFTTKGPGKGTGLGLSVSYGIIKKHHGEIEVESSPGKGTTFTILLPIEDGIEQQGNENG